MANEWYKRKLKKIQLKNKKIELRNKLKAEKNKYKPKMKTSNKVLIASIIAVISFTIVCLCMQYITGMEVSSTLITLWYSFWTVEIASLAGIKISKVFKDYHSETENNLNNNDSNDAVG